MSRVGETTSAVGVGRARRPLDAGRSPSAERDDIDPVPAAADPVAAQLEAELALDVGRDDRTRFELRRAEPAKRRSARLEARLFVLAAHEALVGHGGREGLAELRLRHDLALGVALVEELDRLVEGGAVDDRVVRAPAGRAGRGRTCT